MSSQYKFVKLEASNVRTGFSLNDIEDYMNDKLYQSDTIIRIIYMELQKRNPAFPDSITEVIFFLELIDED